MIPRFLFAPIEETFFTFFAGLVGQGDGERVVPREKIDTAAQTLRTLLSFVLLVSLVIAVFAQVVEPPRTLWLHSSPPLVMADAVVDGSHC